MNILETIFVTIISTSVVSILSSVFIKPIYKKINKLFGRDIGERHYEKRNGNRIYIFPKKQETRVSISVLAKIEKDEKFLLISKKPTQNRQDSIFKPLGGVIKISNNIHEIFQKAGGYREDKRTRYSSKEKDARIFIKLNNNKIIDKAIYSEKLEFYQKELFREIREELGDIGSYEVNEIFEFGEKQQPVSVQVYYTEPNFSFLRCHDYVHHIIFQLEVKDNKLLDQIMLKNKKIQ